MVVKLDSITQVEFVSSSRYFAKLCDYVLYMIFHSRWLIFLLFAAYRSLFDSGGSLKDNTLTLCLR